MATSLDHTGPAAGTPAAPAAAHAPPPIPLEAAHVEPTAPLPQLGKHETIETLLTPRGPAGADPDFVHLGSLRVEKALFDDFKTAERYLARDPEALAMLGSLVHNKDPHTIRRIDANDPLGDRFEPHGTFVPGHAKESGGDIYWNPHGALRNTDGSATSPAVALVHEQGHAWEWSSDPNGYLRGVTTKTLRFTTAEEQRNERHIEAHVATTLGEPVRQNHLGEPFAVTSPVSRTPLVVPSRRYTQDEMRAAIDATGDFYRQHGYPAPPHAAGGPDAIVPWDGKAHSGSLLQIDANTAVQHLGRGHYAVYDVDRDLHGKYPPQFEPLSIDAHGVLRDERAATHARPEPGR